MVAPAEVVSGRSCGCTCPGCACPLLARKGEQNVWHFAHDGMACSTGAETAIHLMAKQILAEECNILLPAVVVSLSAVDVFGRERVVRAQLANPQHARYLEVALEVTRDNRRPDAVARCQSPAAEHRVEIFVRHAVDSTKASELEALDCVCYEICLNDVSLQATTELLRQAVIATPARVRWISYPGMAAARRRLAENLRKMLASAEAQKKAEEAQAKLSYAAQVRESKAEQTAWGRRAREQKRGADRVSRANALFKAAGVADKREYLWKKLRIPEDQAPALVDHEVRGEESFGVPREIWQADVYRKAVFSSDASEVGLGELLAWMKLRYEVVDSFPNSSKVALWEYFAHLEVLKIARHGGQQSFRILDDIAPWLKPLLEVSGSWFWRPEAGSCTLQDLQEVNDAGEYKLSSDTLLAILRRVSVAHTTKGEPDDAARSLAQRLPLSANTILQLLSAARVVSQPQLLPARNPPRRNEPFDWPEPR